MHNECLQVATSGEASISFPCNSCTSCGCANVKLLMTFLFKIAAHIRELILHEITIQIQVSKQQIRKLLKVSLLSEAIVRMIHEVKSTSSSKRRKENLIHFMSFHRKSFFFGRAEKLRFIFSLFNLLLSVVLFALVRGPMCTRSKTKLVSYAQSSVSFSFISFLIPFFLLSIKKFFYLRRSKYRREYQTILNVVCGPETTSLILIYALIFSLSFLSRFGFSI